MTRISAEQRQATSNQLLIHEAHRTNGQAVHLLMVSHDLPLMREPAEKLTGSCAEAAKIGLRARESCANRLNYFHFRRCANHARDYVTWRDQLNQLSGLNMDCRRMQVQQTTHSGGLSLAKPICIIRVIARSGSPSLSVAIKEISWAARPPPSPLQTHPRPTAHSSF